MLQNYQKRKEKKFNSTDIHPVINKKGHINPNIYPVIKPKKNEKTSRDKKKNIKIKSKKRH